MNKKTLFRTAAAVLAAAQLFTCTAFAAITDSTGDYYWYEDFNSGIASMKKSPAGITADEYQRGDSDKAVKLSATAGSKMGYIPLGKLDFSKPVIISYDVMTTASTILYGTLAYTDTAAKTDINLAFLPRFDNGNKIQGYAKLDSVETDYAVNGNGVGNKASSLTYAANKWYTVQAALVYDSETEILTVKQYIDGKPLTDADGTPFEYKMKRNNMSTVMASNMTLRFNVGQGKSAVIDNVMIRREGNIDLNNGGWIQSGNTTVAFTDTASYAEDALKGKYSIASDKITSKNDFELMRYEKSDLLLLNGTAVEASKSFTAGANGISLYGLQRTDTSEFIIFKLKDTEKVTSFSGTPVTNPYALLHSGTTTIVRETHLYDADGAELHLDNGKLPEETAKIVITLSYKDYVNVDAADVKITNGNDSVASTQSGNVYTIDLSENPLSPAEEYTISAGTVSETLTTTGTKPVSPYATAQIETFDDENAVNNFYRSNKDEITLTAENGKMKYANTKASGTNYISYTFDDSFDFTKGSMLVSFDVTLNQEIGWKQVSYFILPQLCFGTVNSVAGSLPAIEHYGVYYADKSGNRTKTTDAKTNMKKGDSCNLSALFTYYADTDELGCTVFVDGRRLYKDATKEIIEEYRIANASDFINQKPLLKITGRNFADGGLYIDNLLMTAVDGITADEILETSGGTAQINIKNTVSFADGTNPALTAPKYTNELTKDDITLTKYSADDKLLLNGAVNTEYAYDKDTLTFGNLDETAVYVIKLNNTSKIKSLSGREIDKKYFKVNGNGLVKTEILDASGNEIYTDANGRVPSGAAKLKLIFTDGFVTGDVKIGETSAVADNGAYVFDFADTPLAADTEYTVNVNGAEYGKFTTTSGEFKVSKPVMGDDGKCSVYVRNTTNEAQTIYIISAAYDGNDLMNAMVYDKFTVPAKTSGTYTLDKIPDLTSSSVQRAFVWDGFEEMLPYCDDAERTL